MIDADFTEEPKKEVNYKDRALRGALIGALLGGGLGGSIGLGKGGDIGSRLDYKDFEDRFPSPEYPSYSGSREEYDADMAKYHALSDQHSKDRMEHLGNTKGLIGGGLGALLGAGLGAGVGAGAGALHNMFTGYANEDLITRSEPNTARKALLMGLLGAAGGGTLGAVGARDPLQGGLIGGGLGAGAGALAAVVNDYLNRDFYESEKQSTAADAPSSRRNTTIKIASNLNNMLTKQALKANDLVDMDSYSGLLADYYPVGGLNAAGHARAGRATAMADAVDQDPGFYVKHPLTSSVLTTLPTALLGAAGGVYATQDSDPLTRLLSGVGGGVAGGLLGNVVASAIRRNSMKDIAKAFDAAKSRKAKDFELGSQLLPLGGMHDLARAEAVQAIRGKLDPSEVGNYGAYPYAAYAGDLAGGLVGIPVPLGSIGVGVAAREEARKVLGGKKKK